MPTKVAPWMTGYHLPVVASTMLLRPRCRSRRGSLLPRVGVRNARPLGSPGANVESVISMPPFGQITLGGALAPRPDDRHLMVTHLVYSTTPYNYVVTQFILMAPWLRGPPQLERASGGPSNT